MLFVIFFFFQNQPFSKNSFKNTIRVRNNLDPDQAQLGPNCLQRLSADNISRQRVKSNLYLALLDKLHYSSSLIQLYV